MINPGLSGLSFLVVCPCSSQPLLNFQVYLRCDWELADNHYGDNMQDSRQDAVQEDQTRLYLRGLLHIGHITNVCQSLQTVSCQERGDSFMLQ